MRHLKILVLGRHGVGKTTLIQCVSNHAVSTDVNGTTVCLDFGTIQYQNFKAHLFGSPGMAQFGLVRKALSNGSDGIILVVDSTDPNSIREGEAYVRQIYGGNPPPIAVAANKQDQPGALHPKQIQALLTLPAPVFPTQAHRGIGLDQLFISFIRHLGNIGAGLNLPSLLERA